MKTKLYTKLPVYTPSEKVWQNIEKELDALQKPQGNNRYAYLWSLVAGFVLVFFVTIFLTGRQSSKDKKQQGIQITYSEENFDTLLVQNTQITAIQADIEIESLCELQPVKCEDEYAKSLLKQIQDLSNASSELDQSTAGQSVPDVTVQKQKAHLEKEKHKRIKKLKRYLNE